MSREQFITVVTDLRKAAMETTEPAEWQARRDSILDAAGVTDSALVAFAAAHGERIPYMLEVWDTIEGRLRPAEQRDTAVEQ